MSKVDDSSIAEVYAQALFELAEERQQSEAVEEELAELGGLLDSDADFRTFMRSPVIDSDRRAPVLEKLFRGKISDTMLDSLQVLNRRSRLDCLEGVGRGFHKLLFERRRRVDVYVTSAVALDDDQRRKLGAAISGRFGREARLVEKVDAELLGGLVIRIGDTKFDGSVSHHLRRVHQSLKERAANELHGGRTYVEGAV